MFKLTTKFVKSLIASRIKSIQNCLIMPFATGCTLNYVFMNLKLLYPSRKYIVWFRIDQKSCIKSMKVPGVDVLVIQPLI
mmetsp:Transcript_117347/g.252321  ORF Transcript_117347/g.252321 Transcript_117347/m.252321 type:complete len:80 (-) Transcript_117347:74-313(-)